MLLRFHLVVQDLNCSCHHRSSRGKKMKHKIQARCGQPDSDTYLPNPICTALHRFFIHFGNSAIYLATRASRASGGFGRLAPRAPRRLGQPWQACAVPDTCQRSRRRRRRRRRRLVLRKVHWIGRRRRWLRRRGAGLPSTGRGAAVRRCLSCSSLRTAPTRYTASKASE